MFWALHFGLTAVALAISIFVFIYGLCLACHSDGRSLFVAFPRICYPSNWLNALLSLDRSISHFYARFLCTRIDKLYNLIRLTNWIFECLTEFCRIIFCLHLDCLNIIFSDIIISQGFEIHLHQSLL